MRGGSGGRVMCVRARGCASDFVRQGGGGLSYNSSVFKFEHRYPAARYLLPPSSLDAPGSLLAGTAYTRYCASTRNDLRSTHVRQTIVLIRRARCEGSCHPLDLGRPLRHLDGAGVGCAPFPSKGRGLGRRLGWLEVRRQQASLLEALHKQVPDTRCEVLLNHLAGKRGERALRARQRVSERDLQEDVLDARGREARGC